MLILTRKSEESIIIGTNIKVKVLKIQDKQVHVGIDAPASISVYRKEIYDQIMKENRKTVLTSADESTLDMMENKLHGIKEKINGR